jgi:HAD superfamily hydrolase (TIGR01509 family)
MPILIAMRAIVFDMDGLMIDSEKIYWAVGRQIAREFGKEVKDETLGRMMGRSPLDSVKLFARETGIDMDPKLLHEMREARVLQALKAGVDPMPGLMEILKKFKPLYKLGIATSAPRYMVDVILGGLKIAHCFDAIQTSDDVTHGKPDPEIYLKAFARLGVSPSDAVVLEDSSNGTQAGKRSGAYTIAVPSPYTRDQDFSYADEIAQDLFDAAGRIAAHAG